MKFMSSRSSVIALSSIALVVTSFLVWRSGVQKRRRQRLFDRCGDVNQWPEGDNMQAGFGEGIFCPNQHNKYGEHIKLFLERDYRIIWIVWDRLASSANVVSTPLLDELNAVLDRCDQIVHTDRLADACVVISAKENFCLGANLDELYPELQREKAEAAADRFKILLRRIELFKVPVIAAVQGLALGGGFELCLACRYRVIGCDKGKMGLPECLLGVIPGAGGCVRLPKLVGMRTAIQWILTSAIHDARTLLRAGAVDGLIPEESRDNTQYRFVHGVRAWVSHGIQHGFPPIRRSLSWVDWGLELTALGRSYLVHRARKTLNSTTKGKYPAPYEALKCIAFAVSSRDEVAAYHNESQSFGMLLVSPEAKNLMSLFFIDETMKKADVKFGVPKSAIPALGQVRTVGNSSHEAGDFVFALLKRNVAVRSVCPSASESATLTRHVHGLFEMLRTKRKWTDDMVATAMQRWTILDAHTENSSLQDENAVVFDFSLGQRDNGKVQVRMLGALSEAPLDLAAPVLQLFFSPSEVRSPLVEIVAQQNEQEKPLLCAALFQLLVRVEKKPIVLFGESVTMSVSQTLLALYFCEVLRLFFNDGLSIQEIEGRLGEFGMKLSPFELMDTLGLPRVCDLVAQLDLHPESDAGQVSFPQDVLLSSSTKSVGPLVQQLRRMIQRGAEGKGKNGKGFYRYGPTNYVQGLNNEFDDARQTQSVSNVSSSDIVDRCILQVANEAVRFLSSKAVQSPEDIDVIAVFGPLGFPPYRGGLLQYMDHRGVGPVVQRLDQLAEFCHSDRFAACPALRNMAADSANRFYPHRPFVPYVERDERIK